MKWQSLVARALQEKRRKHFLCHLPWASHSCFFSSYARAGGVVQLSHDKRPSWCGKRPCKLLIYLCLHHDAKPGFSRRLRASNEGLFREPCPVCMILVQNSRSIVLKFKSGTKLVFEYLHKDLICKYRIQVLDFSNKAWRRRNHFRKAAVSLAHKLSS